MRQRLVLCLYLVLQFLRCPYYPRVVTQPSSALKISAGLHGSGRRRLPLTPNKNPGCLSSGMLPFLREFKDTNFWKIAIAWDLTPLPACDFARFCSKASLASVSLRRSALSSSHFPCMSCCQKMSGVKASSMLLGF